MTIKICHITSAHPRYDTRIFYKECTSLVNAGYEVILLVAEKKGSQPEINKGVSIIPVHFEPKNRFDRIFNSPKVMLKKALEVNADIYHFHDPELLQIALKLKKNNKKVIFDSHEDVCGQILSKKWIPGILRPIVSYLYMCYSNHVLSKLDHLIGVTPHLVDKLRIINPNTEMITNYPIVNSDLKYRFESQKTANSFCFAGGIDEQWNHETILFALEEIDAKYSLMGRADEHYLEGLKKNLSWVKVQYHGILPHQEVLKELSSCVAGLAILDYSENTCGKLGTLGNTKLFEYMQAGLPVICSDFVLWKDIIEEWDCGICIPPRDVIALRNAIQYMIDNPEKAKEMGKNGRQAVLEEFNWGIEEKKLISLYRKLEMSHGVHAV